LTLVSASCRVSSSRAIGRSSTFDHQDLTLVGDPYSGALKRLPACRHGLVVQEHVDDTRALTGEGRKARDTDPGFASNLPRLRQ